MANAERRVAIEGDLERARGEALAGGVDAGRGGRQAGRPVDRRQAEGGMAHDGQSSVPPGERAATDGERVAGPVASRYDGRVTTPANPPGDRRPRLDRPPGERYRPAPPAADAGRARGRLDALLVPAALILGGAIAFVVLGGILLVTAGLVVLAAFLGWLTGRLVSPPALAAGVGLAVVVVGLLGIWAWSRIEGGVLDPIAYLDEVEGLAVVGLSLLAGAGLAAAASR
jgi:hypothetical protein